MKQTLIAALCMAATAHAAAAGFPNKPIRLLIHFPAGSSTDVIGRVLAERAAATLGQSIVVDNRPGADGAIAAAEVKRSAPDGYTIMLATNSAMSGVPVMKKSPPYDVTQDFTPITDVGRYTFFVYINQQMPAKTLQELVAQAKAHPGTFTYAAGNVTGQLSFAQIALASGIDATHVPYKGEPPAMTDLVAARVDAMVATAGTGLPYVQTGKLRALAVITQKRSPALPDVPTVREAGFPQFSIEPWAGLFGPAKMPREAIEALNREFVAAMKNPDVSKKLASQYFPFSPSTPEALGTLVKRQLEVHREIARSAGVQPD